MNRYNVILVDGELAIEWEDETRAEAVDRARAGAAVAEYERRWTLGGARRETEAVPGSVGPAAAKPLTPGKSGIPASFHPGGTDSLSWARRSSCGRRH
jgi:hypothetical protein